MRYIKRFNSINEGLSKISYVYDIKDILHDLDMVDIPAAYKQEIKFTIDDINGIIFPMKRKIK